MVEPIDTSVAIVAVAAPRRPDQPALRAETSRTECFHKLGEVHLLVFLDIARIAENESGAKEETNAKEYLCRPIQPLPSTLLT